MTLTGLALACALAVSTAAVADDASVRLYAAGSLRAAMTDVIAAFVAAGGPPVVATWGASGLLRERIEHGDAADVFASADLGHPQALARAGRAAAPVVFARNRLCALVAPGIAVTSDTLLDRMLDPVVRLGTSTPKADPAGDYAWLLFERADRLRPGAFGTLAAKALPLTGGPNSPPPPPDRSAYGALIAEGKADLFLTYCTNALRAVGEVPGARSVAVPDTLAVGADYGITLVAGASAGARRFVDFVLAPSAQAILVRHGFAAGTSP